MSQKDPTVHDETEMGNKEQVSHLQVLPAIFKKANWEQVCHFQRLPAMFQKANREQVCHSKCYLPCSRKQTGNRCVIRSATCHIQEGKQGTGVWSPSTTCHIQEGKQGTGVSIQVLPAIFKKANREQVYQSKYYLPYSRRQTGNRCVNPSTTCHIQEGKQGTGVSFQVLPAIFKKANREQVYQSKYYLPYSRRQTGNRCINPSTTCHIQEGKQGTGVSIQVLPAIFKKANREQVCHSKCYLPWRQTGNRCVIPSAPAIFKKANREQVCQSKYYLPYSRRQTGNRCVYLPYSRRQTGNRCVIPSATCHIQEGKQGTGVSFQVLPAIFKKANREQVYPSKYYLPYSRRVEWTRVSSSRSLSASCLL